MLASIAPFALLVCLSHPCLQDVTVQRDAVARAERVNINLADAAELERLPGIGRVIALRIIEHRRRNGYFARPQDVIIVRGMSARRYRLIAHLIRT